MTNDVYMSYENFCLEGGKDIINTGHTIHKTDIFFSETVKLKNILMKNEGLKIVIKDPVFVIDFIENKPEYFHVLIDYLGTYELMCKKIPDLKIMILYSEKFFSNEKVNTSINKEPLLGIINQYKIKNNFIINVDIVDTIVFEKLFMSGVDHGSLLCNLYNNLNDFKITFDTMKVFHLKLSKLLKKRFFISENTVTNKKIFLSRLKANTKNRELQQALIKKYKMLVPNNEMSEKELQLIDTIPEKIVKESLYRPLSLEDETLIEKFFFDSGYEVVDLSTMSILNQAKLISKCTHIAGFPGTGMANLVFCKKNTRIILINTCNAYRFPHALQASFYSNDITEVFPIDRARSITDEAFSGKQILDYIANNDIDV
jgi:hypothetical protein